MEKYARQALQEGVKDEQELLVNEDHELYRVLNVHYNRNNHIEVSLTLKLILITCYINIINRKMNYEIASTKRLQHLCIFAKSNKHFICH